MQSTLQHQLRPLISSIGSLEKVIQIQEDRRDNTSRTSQKVTTSSTNWTYEKIQSVMEDYLSQRYPNLNEAVTSLALDNTLIEQREYLLNEITRQQNELRRETELNEREFLISIKRKFDEKFQEINGGIKETR